MPNIISCLTTENWIAIGAAGIVLGGIVVGSVRWYLSGFRPRLQAWIDGPRQRIKVRVRNLGRTCGQVENVSFIVINSKGREVTQDYKRVEGEDFPALLSSSGTVQFVAEAISGVFCNNVRVRVTVKGKQYDVCPKRLESNESFTGAAQAPPSTERGTPRLS